MSRPQDFDFAAHCGVRSFRALFYSERPLNLASRTEVKWMTRAGRAEVRSSICNEQMHVETRVAHSAELLRRTSRLLPIVGLSRHRVNSDFALSQRNTIATNV